MPADTAILSFKFYFLQWWLSIQRLTHRNLEKGMICSVVCLEDDAWYLCYFSSVKARQHVAVFRQTVGLCVLGISTGRRTVVWRTAWAVNEWASSWMNHPPWTKTMTFQVLCIIHHSHLLFLFNLKIWFKIKMPCPLNKPANNDFRFWLFGLRYVSKSHRVEWVAYLSQKFHFSSTF